MTRSRTPVATLSTRRRKAPGFTIPEKDYRGGSKVTGPGSETSDSVPAALSKNEFVIRAKSAKRIGYDVLHHMNRTGEVPMRMTKVKRRPPGNGRLTLAFGGPARRQPPGKGRLLLQFGGVSRKEQLDEQERVASGEPSEPKTPTPTGVSSDRMTMQQTKESKQGVLPGMAESLKIRFGGARERPYGFAKGGKTGLRKGYATGGKAHPGFKAVAKKIGKQPGIRNPGAVLAAASRGASAAAKRANPRLNRVK